MEWGSAGSPHNVLGIQPPLPSRLGIVKRPWGLHSFEGLAPEGDEGLEGHAALPAWPESPPSS